MWRLVLTLWLTSLSALALPNEPNDDRNVISFPNSKASCDRIVQVHQALEYSLDPGRLYLYDGQLVLVTDGEYKTYGRENNYWNWVEIFPSGLGRNSHGYNSERKFQALPKETALWFDFRRAYTWLKNTLPTVDLKPGVFRTDGSYVLLLRAGTYSIGGRYEFRIKYQIISEEGRVAPEVLTKKLAPQDFLATWHPVEGYRLAVSNLRGEELFGRPEKL